MNDNQYTKENAAMDIVKVMQEMQKEISEIGPVEASILANWSIGSGDYNNVQQPNA